MARQTYTMNEGPDYTIVTYYTPTDAITLDEWTGRSPEEFNAGMRRKGGFTYSKATYTLPGGRVITEHTWTK